LYERWSSLKTAYNISRSTFDVLDSGIAHVTIKKV
jgi:hypothetical protein